MLKDFFARINKRHGPHAGPFDIFKYLGPGFLVTVGFIDPGNWATNVAAGAQFGYALLWIVGLGTAMLVLLQHNAARLGIVTGLCLAESAAVHFKPWVARFFLISAFVAVVATVLAELLGAAIGLQMLFSVPLPLGALLTAIFVGFLSFTNSYRRIERYLIAGVSLIGISFIYELTLVSPNWNLVATRSVIPSLPMGSIAIVVGVLGAIVMPHNIFLHSEIIQSRQWNLAPAHVFQRQLRFQFLDTLLAMGMGWVINSAMIVVAAAVFYRHGINVTELEQAQVMLNPLVGKGASVVFAIALLLAGLTSSTTACMAAGSVVAGFFNEPLDLEDSHSRAGVIAALLISVGAIFTVTNSLRSLIWSQIALSIQLPLTVIGLLALTSSKKVMGEHANSLLSGILLWMSAAIVIFLNIMLFFI